MTDPKPVTFKPDGPVKIELDADGVPTMTGKAVSSTMENILSYGIENIVDIRSYNIEQKDGKIFHHVVFHSGGTIELSMDLDGNNFKARAKDMISSVSNGERILIKERNSK